MRTTPTYLLESLSNNDVTFFIPPYQRNYEWSTDNCKVLLSDIKKVAQSNVSGTNTEHFFGSIVYVIEDSGFGLPAKYILTDGQQRITTTMLFLMALRDSISDENYKDTIQTRYLENNRADESTEYKIKLKQVETDWEAYKSLALGLPVAEDQTNSSVYRNYSFFLREIKDLEDSHKRDLLERGLSKFSIISIQLEPDRNPWENPQEIFESMNSLGKPLSLADLVRNYLLMGKNSHEQTALYNKYWLTLEKRLPGKLSEFIRDWMQSDQHRSFKVAKESNYKDLYGSFKDIVQNRSVENIFGSFVAYSRPYSIICGLSKSNNHELNQIIADLNVIGVGPAYSYLTEVLALQDAKELSSESIVQFMVGMRTYILRRRVLGVTQGENKVYPVLGMRLSEFSDRTDISNILFRQLSSQEYALRLPNDSEMISRLEGMNFYNLGRSRHYPRLLLSLIEQTLTKSRPAWDDQKLQLEHVMPQKLNSNWKQMLGGNFEEVHQEYLNNIGNITLIRHNQELGNKSFDDKKETYQGNSGLQVTQNRIIDRAEWNELSIIRRRDYIISLLIDDVFQVPNDFKRASNWSQLEKGSSQFDSREMLNQLIGETITYVPNPIIEAEVISDSKVRFEDKEWALGTLTKELKSRVGKVSKSSNFHGPTNWSWEGTRLVDLDI